MILLGLAAGTLGGAAVVAAAPDERAAPSPRRAALPSPPAPGLPIGAARSLDDGPDVSRWAHVRRAVVARARPGRGRRAVAKVAFRTPEGTVTALPVVGRRVGRDGALWLRVVLPVLPNGTRGWVPRRALGAYEVARHRLVVDLAARRMTLFARGHAVFRAAVGVGRPIGCAVPRAGSRRPAAGRPGRRPAGRPRRRRPRGSPAPPRT
jgi:hypothetical protein